MSSKDKITEMLLSDKEQSLLRNKEKNVNDANIVNSLESSNTKLSHNRVKKLAR